MSTSPKWGNPAKCLSQQQAILPACSSHCLLNAKRQAGKLCIRELTFFTIFFFCSLSLYYFEENKSTPNVNAKFFFPKFCRLDTLQDDRNFSGGAKNPHLHISKTAALRVIIFSPNDSKSQDFYLSIIHHVGLTPLFFELLRKNCIFTLYCVY